MLGLFMLVPVLALYAHALPGATPFLVGLALGIYGLTQALCQIPFGILSDRIGRRPVIAAGLLVFVAGSAIGALAQHVVPVLIGRAVQGAGAVSGATLALVADLTRAEQRTKVMALIGISIGAAFALAFVLGPALDALIGLRGLFIAAGACACAAIGVLHLCVPQGPVTPRATSSLHEVLAVRELAPAFFGVLALHLVLAATFVAAPVALRDGLGLASGEHYRVYLPALVASLALVAPLMIASTRARFLQLIAVLAVGALALAEFLLTHGWGKTGLTYIGLIIFFTAFNFLEAALPGLISRLAPAAHKGAALGAYATFQFLGMFAGGIIGGLVAQYWGFNLVPLACGFICLIWLAVTLGIWRPEPVSSFS
jgi:MFS family permease